MNDSEELLERIEKAKAKLIRDMGAAVQQPKKETHSQELLDAKNVMSPLSLIVSISQRVFNDMLKGDINAVYDSIHQRNI